MTRRRKLQHALWLTAVLATAFFLHVPLLRVPFFKVLLYGVYVFLPQAVAIILQLREIHERYAEAFRKPEEKAFAVSHAKSQPPRRRAAIYTSNSFTAIKCSGINPNRAGPAPAFA